MPPDDEVRRLRRRALLRVGLAAALLAAIFAVVRLTGLSPSAKRLEHWADGLGVFGPIIFIAAGVALNCVFVPIPVLAGAAGLVFGTAEGTAVGVVVVDENIDVLPRLPPFVAESHVHLRMQACQLGEQTPDITCRETDLRQPSRSGPGAQSAENSDQGEDAGLGELGSAEAELVPIFVALMT